MKTILKTQNQRLWKPVTVFFVIVVLSSTFAKAQGVAGKADELLTTYFNQKKFSGNVLIAKQGEIIFQKAYGFSDVQGQTPNTLSTQFNIASITKTFTAALILKLSESGYLSINDRLNKFIPDYPGGNKILVRHLLSHSSGIVDYTANPQSFDVIMNKPISLEDAIMLFKHDPLKFEPGTKSSYSSSNYVLLSYIAEQVSRRSLPALYKKEIFKKLEMTETGMESNEKVAFNKAKSYLTDPASGDWVESKPGNVANTYGAGAIYSTVGDLYKWTQSFNTNKILTAASINMTATAYLGEYGYGWTVKEKNGKTEISHSGKSLEGYVANVTRYPNEDVTIIFLSNYGDTDEGRLSEDLKAIVFDEKYQLPVQKKEASLSKEVLNRLVGSYELNENFKVIVSTEGNKLYGIAEGDTQKIELKAESGLKFLLKGPEIEVEFIEEDGRIQYLVIKQQGGLRLKKIS